MTTYRSEECDDGAVSWCKTCQRLNRNLIAARRQATVDRVGHHAGDGAHLTRRATAIRAMGIRTAGAMAPRAMGPRVMSGPPEGRQPGETPPTMMTQELHVRFPFLQFPGAFCGVLAA